MGVTLGQYIRQFEMDVAQNTDILVRYEPTVDPAVEDGGSALPTPATTASTAPAPVDDWPAAYVGSPFQPLTNFEDAMDLDLDFDFGEPLWTEDFDSIDWHSIVDPPNDTVHL